MGTYARLSAGQHFYGFRFLRVTNHVYCRERRPGEAVPNLDQYICSASFLLLPPLARVQVPALESCRLPEPGQIVDADAALAHRQQLPIAQLTQNTIDVDGFRLRASSW